MLTIGLPVYNGERYLEAAVESLLDQTFEDFRLVISDNASDDSTPEILAQFAKQDSRVEVLTSPVNRGANWNFNAVAQDVTTPVLQMERARRRSRSAVPRRMPERPDL